MRVWTFLLHMSVPSNILSNFVRYSLFSGCHPAVKRPFISSGLPPPPLDDTQPSCGERQAQPHEFRSTNQIRRSRDLHQLKQVTRYPSRPILTRAGLAGLACCCCCCVRLLLVSDGQRQLLQAAARWTKKKGGWGGRSVDAFPLPVSKVGRLSLSLFFCGISNTLRFLLLVYFVVSRHRGCEHGTYNRVLKRRRSYC